MLCSAFWNDFFRCQYHWVHHSPFYYRYHHIRRTFGGQVKRIIAIFTRTLKPVSSLWFSRLRSIRRQGKNPLSEVLSHLRLTGIDEDLEDYYHQF
jgi:hypothetical protein